MDNNDDLEYREERTESKQPVKKIHIPLKLKSRSANPISVKLSPSIQKSTSFGSDKNSPVKISTNNDISSQLNNNVEVRKDDLLKNKTAGEYLTDHSYKRTHAISGMNWNLNNSSSYQIMKDQTMDFCMICNLPILIYGRLIPCKHVMCLQCANSIDIKVCLKEYCNERIDRIEKASRGGIFVCLYDLDNKNSFQNAELIRQSPDISQKKLCGRSYMSQRDLNSHIQHRHDTLANINVPLI